MKFSCQSATFFVFETFLFSQNTIFPCLSIHSMLHIIRFSFYLILFNVFFSLLSRHLRVFQFKLKIYSSRLPVVIALHAGSSTTTKNISIYNMVYVCVCVAVVFWST